MKGGGEGREGDQTCGTVVDPNLTSRLHPKLQYYYGTLNAP